MTIWATALLAPTIFADDCCGILDESTRDVVNSGLRLLLRSKVRMTVVLLNAFDRCRLPIVRRIGGKPMELSG